MFIQKNEEVSSRRFGGHSKPHVQTNHIFSVAHSRSHYSYHPFCWSWSSSFQIRFARVGLMDYFARRIDGATADSTQMCNVHEFCWVKSALSMVETEPPETWASWLICAKHQPGTHVFLWSRPLQFLSHRFSLRHKLSQLSTKGAGV